MGANSAKKYLTFLDSPNFGKYLMVKFLRNNNDMTLAQVLSPSTISHFSLEQLPLCLQLTRQRYRNYERFFTSVTLESIATQSENSRR